MPGSDLSVKKLSPSAVAIISIVLFIFSFLLYFQTIFHDFVNYDDDWLILDNHKIRSLENTARFFTEHTATDYLPMKELSYALDYYFFGTKPAAYHLTDVLLYGLTVVFIFLFLMELSESWRFSAISSMIFLFHPLHAEVVNWASARKDSLSGLFFYASFYFFTRHLKREDLKKSSIYLFSLLLFLLSLLSKPSVITAPILLLVMELTFFNSNKKGLFPAGTLKRIIPFMAVSLFFTFITLNTAVEQDVVKEYWKGSPYVTFLTMITVIGDYMRLVLFPFNLCVRYQIDFQNHFLSSDVLINFLIIILILLSAFLLRKRNRWFFFGICWFFTGILPVSNIIPIAILKADRYIYLPSFGLIIIMAFFLTEIFSDIRGDIGTQKLFSGKMQVKPFISGFAGIILILLALLTLSRSSDWKDGLTLWQDTIKKSPGDYLVLNNMGSTYKELGRYDEAEKLFKMAISAKPDYHAPYFNLSNLYDIYGDSDKALFFILKALELNPDDFKTNINLGNIYRGRKELLNAESAYRRAISIKPDVPEGYYNLAIFYEKEKGLIDEADKLYKTSIQKDRNFIKSFNNLGNIYIKAGDFDKALFYFEKSLEIDRKNVKALNNIASVYIKKGDCGKAVELLKKCLEYNKSIKYVIYYNLYEAYKCTGDAKEADKFLNLYLSQKEIFPTSQQSIAEK